MLGFGVWSGLLRKGVGRWRVVGGVSYLCGIGEILAYNRRRSRILLLRSHVTGPISAESS